MHGTLHTATITVALIGNPNTGKSTVFSALAGVRQQVGNYPGVTVDKKVAELELGGRRFALVDLPGTYSLAPRSPDEMVTVDILLGRRADTQPPDAVICVVDASNLERNLYLVSQVLEFGIPAVIALNMTDVAEAQGQTVDAARLSSRLGVPVVELQAHRKRGIEQLKAAVLKAADRPAARPASPFPPAFQHELDRLQRYLEDRGERRIPRYLLERLLLDAGGYLERAALPGADQELLGLVRESRERLAAAGYPVPAVETSARYGWVHEILEGVVHGGEEPRTTWSDRLDAVLMHRWWGLVVFAAVMVVVFQSIFNWSQPMMEGIEQAVRWIGDRLAGALPEGALRSLLIDGVLHGVGSVLIFLPQILTLFLFIAVLEDCGYMARAAYLMDRLMARIGLSGRSFIPLLSSFACAVPGIMATRVIEDRRDRLATILVAPLMTCSARLPVYTLLIAAFIPNRGLLGGWFGLQGLTLLAMYLLGIATAIVAAWVFKRTILRGEAPAFVLELPSYKVPSPGTVVRRVVDNGWSFISGAGTLILAVAVLVWAAAYYPRDPQVEAAVRADYADQLENLERQAAEVPASVSADAEQAWQAHQQQREELEQQISADVAGAYMEQSYLGQAGRWIAPLVRPLGWDWRIGCAVIASFPAREVVVGSLGVIYHLGEGQDEQSESLRETLRSATWPDTGQKVFNVPVALSLMVFFALCAQCAATLAVIRRETGSWGWPAFTFVYMTGLAYLGALVTYRLGMLFLG